MHTLADLRAGKLAGYKRLDLSCGLTEFPEEIFSLSDSLEVLNLSGNALSELPADLHRLKRLKILFCSDNLFTRLPECLGQCQSLFFIGFKTCRIEHVPAASLPPALRSLVLTGNNIESLPDELGQCTELQKLMMAGNRLTRLPESLAACKRLELVRIAANQLRDLPQWLLRMPALAWLAFAGNPLRDEHTQQPHEQIPWSQLTIDQVLGEGASGVIQQAQWHHEDLIEPVAVKLYKGAITSDGLPQDEMAACLAAGDHPNLIPLLGQFCGHPDERIGLVMRLISPSYTPLAKPPSLESCTRDVYNGTRMSKQTLLRLAGGIAAACAHLHSNGINHGDVYAHNILWQENGESLLGDFGAAAFYPDPDTGATLERIEVRAFGILLGELLALCDASDEDVTELRALEAVCVQANIQGRPSFATVMQELQQRPER
jgi:hypothetical protein